MYNSNSIIHSINSSMNSFGYPDPIPVCVSMSSHTYLHQVILEHQQGAGELSSDAICPETTPDSQVKGSVQDCLPPTTPDAAMDWRFLRPPP